MKLTLNSSQTQPLNDFWTFGGNTCHAALWFRKDLQNHLSIVKNELGFRYARCHGNLNDDMDVVREDGSFNFVRLGDALQILLDIGMKPFLELSSMPGQFASSDSSICKYVFRSAPPKDWNQWYLLIKGLIAYLEDRFGKDELKTWYFEVWNEPDIAFWSGTQDEYFKLYDLAAQAIKEQDSAYRMGGPATARTNWIDEFLAHVAADSSDYTLDTPRCDFIATHAYPSDLEFLDGDVGEVEIQNSNIMRELFTAARQKIDAALGKDFPLIIGEWNSSAGPLATNHDDCNNAAFITKTLVELMPLCQGSLVWNISDIYEECGFHYTPFHGGYGQLTVNDLPKACFYAFKYLAEHSGEQVDVALDEDVTSLGALGTKDGDKTRVTVYYYTEPDVDQPDSVTINLDGISGKVKVTPVVPGAGSAYETWLELGSPDHLNVDSMAKLDAASKPVTSEQDAGAPIEIKKGTIVHIESC